jgi:hypothetical protein
VIQGEQKMGKVKGKNGLEKVEIRARTRKDSTGEMIESKGPVD